MGFVELLRVALTSIRRHILRSILTMLGIMIGVGSVITMVTVAAGARNEIDETMKQLGSTLLGIYSGSRRSRGVSSAQGSHATLTESDAHAIKQEIPDVLASAPYMRGPVQVILGNQNWSTNAYAINEDYLRARNWDVVEGREIELEEFNNGTKVALVGSTVATELFGEGSALGQMIRVNNVPFTIVGTLATKGLSMWGNDFDDVVMLTLKAARLRLLGRQGISGDAVHGLYVTVVDEYVMEDVRIQIDELLRQRHRVPEDQDAFTVRNMSEMIESQLESRNTMNYMLSAIASVSLLVGGIGIMNIMLVSVTERTREIGLRMAVGAKGRHILSQFLFEAITICVVGGAIGIIAAVVASWAFAIGVGWPVLIQWHVMVIAVLFSAAIGVFFGFYPAKVAASKDPIEALRTE